MSEWKGYKFSDFVNINPPVKLINGEQYSYVEMKDLSDGQRHCSPSIERELTGGARFNDGDTLFARITPCLENGKICQVTGLKNGTGFGSTEFFVFRGKKDISDNDFAFYLSRWDEVRAFAEMNFDGTSGRQRVPKDAFNNLFLNLPDLPEQKSIASILSSLDDKIDLLHRQNKTLEASAETLFRQWFIEAAPQPSPHLSHGERDNAEEGWETGKLGDVIELVYGKGLKEEIRTGKGFPVVGSSGIVGHHSEFLVEGPGIVIGRKGTLGKVIYLFENFFPIDTTYFIKSRVNSVGLFYEYFLLKTLNFEEMNTDSAVPGLNRELALSTEIKVAPFDKLKQYNGYCASLFEKLKQNNSQIRTLARLRDTLLPKLMSGEVRGKDSERGGEKINIKTV
ncbi:MAG: hypothetical protein A2Z50_07810 [Nitrospirae bacterium RBG_19FT_COMBO_42_15]|nr:MAG: hypothetical protein A2Z50_07810 [Nitrospirae bacterium RBG_19FT_COMBO_42_15]